MSKQWNNLKEQIVTSFGGSPVRIFKADGERLNGLEEIEPNREKTLYRIPQRGDVVWLHENSDPYRVKQIIHYANQPYTAVIAEAVVG